MKKSPIILILIIVLFSCKHKKEIDAFVDLTSINDPNVTNLSELGSEITYIPLEKDTNCLIKQMDKVIYEGESFFLGSTNKYPLTDEGSPFLVKPRSELYRFSRDGKFICQIGREGRAPSEYSSIKDFIYKESSNTIDIFSGNKVQEFSLDGIWKKNITIEYDRVASLGHANNQFLGFIDNTAGQNEYSFVLIDANGQIVNSFGNKYKFSPTQGSFYPSECIFYRYNNTLHCKELHSDTIFSFDSGSFMPKYILKQGDAKYTSDLRENEQYFYRHYDKIIIQSNLFESKNYLFLQYIWKNRDNCLIKNKINETQYLIDNGIGLVNNLDNGPNLKIQNTVTVDGSEYLISWINAFELKAHVDSEVFKKSIPQYSEKKKALKKLANSLSEDDNPVLMLVKLKE